MEIPPQRRVNGLGQTLSSDQAEHVRPFIRLGGARCEKGLHLVLCIGWNPLCDLTEIVVKISISFAGRISSKFYIDIDHIHVK